MIKKANYDIDLNSVLDQLSKFENSVKDVKNSTIDSTTLFSTDKSTNESSDEHSNIILPVTIGGVVLVTISTSLITFFILRRRRVPHLYAGTVFISSSNSINNLSNSKKPSYEGLVSIGCEF